MEAVMAKGIKGLDWIVKIILVILYDIYGIIARVTSGKTLPAIIGVVQIFTLNVFGILWLIDLISVILKKEISVLA